MLTIKTLVFLFVLLCDIVTFALCVTYRVRNLKQKDIRR